MSDGTATLAGMPDAFTTLWTHDTCRALRRAGHVGRRPPVAFSGIHTSLPSWVSVHPGDDVFALYVNRCVVHVVSRMRVLDKDRGGCCGPEPSSWNEPAFPGHADWSMLGAGGCGAAAVHVAASPVRFDVAIPGSTLAGLTWRNRRGVVRGLKFVVDGRLERAIGLHGVYRLTEESTAMLAALVDSVAPRSDCTKSDTDSRFTRIPASGMISS